MSYAEAKEIALLRLELRACWDHGDRQGAADALSRLGRLVRAAKDEDPELARELRRWALKLA